MFDDQCFDPVDFACREAMTSREPDRVDPELRLKVFAFNMDMRWLMSGVWPGNVAGAESVVPQESFSCETVLARSLNKNVQVTGVAI